MHYRKSKRILIYFFLLFMLGSINNLNLNNLEFKKLKNIQISGLKDLENEILLNKIKSLNLRNIFFLNDDEIINIIESNSLVESFKIFKKYPNTLDIKLNETKFLARINQNNNIFLIGSNGKLIKSNFSNNELPYIFGKPTTEQFLKFKKIIDISNLEYEKIKSFYFFQSKRWDVLLKNDIILKLPRSDIKNSLNQALLFLNDNPHLEIKVLDFRVEDQIIINE